MSFLIDTCCISELIKPKPDSGVLKWFAAHDEFELYLSVITLGELRYGIDRLPESARKKELRAWLSKELEERFRNRVIPVGPEVARRWGALRSSLESEGRPHPVMDLFIAATALEHNLSVVTRNVDDLRMAGLSLVNPWKQS